MRKTAMLVLVSLWICSIAWGQVFAQSAPAAGARKVDLNTANLADLDTLPGIGPTTAARIIDFRTKNGNFKKAEDLMSVKGIGEKKFLKLKDRITVSGGAPAGARADGAKAQTPAKPAPRKRP